ncbi:hypothetical protein [uncultured Algimonas sp.]|uniref:MinD/ParA family ATP-binding protein n=1 Tax=uncultured Algimonas sp. TaxID=1547920 RepID=UPI00262F1960|nr:hypothetical protein [uncultured Algimonas sp.]
MPNAPRPAQPYRPAGRLVGVVCAAEEPSCHAQMLDATLRLARKAASLGETVLLLDGTDGALMEAAGVLYSRTLDDFIDGHCELRDALFVTSNEHFSAGVIGSDRLPDALGTMAGLSLNYDWVFAVGPAGLSPAQATLAAGADICLLGYDTRIDGFMRAYWTIDAVRRRNRRWDPLTVSLGPREDAAVTALMLRDVVRDHLGAPAPYVGHAMDNGLPASALDKMRTATDRARLVLTA